MKQLCCVCDHHEAVLRLGLSHPKLRSATASLLGLQIRSLHEALFGLV